MSISTEVIDHLSPRERLIMIGQLWDSLDSEDVPVTQAQQDELARRLDSFDQDYAQGINWKKLKDELSHRDA